MLYFIIFCFLSSTFDIPKSVIQDSFALATLNSEYCFKEKWNLDILFSVCALILNVIIFYHWLVHAF